MRNQTKLLKKSLFFITTVLFSVNSSVVSSQLLEEVVVTAQKREQRLQDVGISVSAFSGDQIENLGMTNTTDIVQQVPGMQLQSFSPSFTIFNLRGISQNSFQDNLEAPVAVYVDGAYVASMNAIHGQLFDVERVEVLRGPQGTLFGRNATGGLVHYLTRGADEEELNGYFKAGAGDFDQVTLEGAVGGGITDTVRGRVAARWEKNDGYVESVVPGIRDAHGADGYTVRGALQMDVTNDLTADLRVAHSKDDDVPSGAYSIDLVTFDPATGLGVPAPDRGRVAGPHEHASAFDGFFDRDLTNVTATLTWDINNSMELVSVTNYLDMEKLYLEDAAGGLFPFSWQTDTEFESISQEIRLSGDSGKLRWQTGFYYLDMTTDTEQFLRGVFAGPLPTTRITSVSSLESKNWSLFGEVEYDLADQFTLIAGLRWSDDSKNLDQVRFFQNDDTTDPRTLIFDVNDPAVLGANPGIDTIDYDDYAARLQLNYSTKNGSLIYASFNRGIKGGNWSVDVGGNIPLSNFQHNEEVLLSYELGIKTDINDWARLNASIYYYDYDDYQAFSLAGLTTQINNSDASSHGGELELTTNPVDGLDLMLGVAYVDSEVDAVVDIFGGTIEAEFPNAPEWSVNFLGRYEWPMFGGTMAAQIDGVWNDDQFIEATNSAVSAEDAYIVWNARLSYTTANEHWTLSAWVNNVSDEEYRVYNVDVGVLDLFIAPGLGIAEEVYAQPRWWGVSASYNF